MLNFTYSLFVSTTLPFLMFPIGDSEGLTGAWGLNTKTSKNALSKGPPPPKKNLHCNIQSSTLFRDSSGMSEYFPRD